MCSSHVSSILIVRTHLWPNTEDPLPVGGLSVLFALVISVFVSSTIHFSVLVFSVFAANADVVFELPSSRSPRAPPAPVDLSLSLLLTMHTGLYSEQHRQAEIKPLYIHIRSCLVYTVLHSLRVRSSSFLVNPNPFSPTLSVRPFSFSCPSLPSAYCFVSCPRVLAFSISGRLYQFLIWQPALDMSSACVWPCLWEPGVFHCRCRRLGFRLIGFTQQWPHSGPEPSVGGSRDTKCFQGSADSLRCV